MSDVEARAELGASGDEAAALHWDASWPGHVDGLSAPLFLPHVELNSPRGSHPALVFVRANLGDGQVVNDLFFCVLPADETVPTLHIVPLDRLIYLRGDDFLGSLSLGARCRRGFQSPVSTNIASE